MLYIDNPMRYDKSCDLMWVSRSKFHQTIQDYFPGVHRQDSAREHCIDGRNDGWLDTVDDMTRSRMARLTLTWDSCTIPRNMQVEPASL